MNRFLKHWRGTGRGDAYHAQVVAYADDFVILSRDHAAEALAWTRAVMSRLGLTLNESKTAIRDALQVSLLRACVTEALWGLCGLWEWSKLVRLDLALALGQPGRLRYQGSCNYG